MTATVSARAWARIILFGSLLSSLALLGLVRAAEADALDATKPSPPPCSGLAFTDPPDDRAAPGPAGPAYGDDSNDLIGGFFKTSETEEVTFNFVVKNLTKATPPGFTLKTYNLTYSVEGKARYAQVLVDAQGSVTGNYGTVGTSPTGGNTIEGATQVKLFEGQNGIAQMVIPSAAGGAPGSVLEKPVGQTQGRYAAVPDPTSPGEFLLISGGQTIDRGPNTGEGKPYTAGACGADGPVPPGTPGPPAGTPPGTAPPATVASVTLSASPTTVTAGGQVTLSGRVEPTTKGTSVEIVATEKGKPDRVLGTFQTDENGGFSTTDKPGASTTYVARAGAVSSSPVAVTVQASGGTRRTQSKLVKLKLNFSRFGGSAKSLNRKKVIVLKVRSTGRIKNLRAALRIGTLDGKQVGAGALASLNGKGTLRVRITKKLKPGKYVLVVLGKDAQGRSGIASARLRFS